MDRMSLKPFLPGQNFRINTGWYRKANPIFKEVKIDAPGRIHFSIFNFAKMIPPAPGGGGIGISVSCSKNSVILKSKIKEPKSSEIATVVHLIKLFKKLTGYTSNDIQIKVGRRIRELHSGFGSNVSLNTAVFQGLNLLFGEPFSKKEVYDILTNNYIENDELNAKKVRWGHDTGVGEACLLFGGFTLTDENGNYVGNVPTQPMNVLMAIARKERFVLSKKFRNKSIEDIQDTDTAETAELQTKKFMKEYGPQLKKLFGKLERSFKNNNIESLKNIIWQLNTCGVIKYLEEQYTQPLINRVTELSKEKMAFYSGMSSAGPSMFVISDDLEILNEIKNILKKESSGYFDFAIGEAGNTLKVSKTI